MVVENRYANDVPASTCSTASADKAVVFSPELLQMYYARLFPFDLLHSWLSYGNIDNSYFKNREFSFTLQAPGGEEIYVRHQSFPDQTALAAAMTKKRPIKIDLGAVYAAPPNKHAIQSGRNEPVSRELVFDIDLTDYDSVRNCGCSGASICTKCWEFMKLAVTVMDQGLREDFGFESIAWFYSGRRGVHAWVCDEQARALTDEGRSAVAKYFDVSVSTV
jgi:DNA primase small subunit